MRALLLATVLLSTPAAAKVEGVAYVLKDFRWEAVFVDLDICIAASSALSGTTCEAISIKDGEAFVRSRQPLNP